MKETVSCEWCSGYLKKDELAMKVHLKCYSLMYNYARRFQELKELLTQPDFVEVKQP